MRATSCQRCSPSVRRSSSPWRRRSASARTSPASGSRSRVPSETVTCSPSISSRSSPARCSRSQGAPENWMAWVSSWIVTQASELLAVDLHRARGLGEVGGDEQQARRDRGVEQREVVLAEDPLGEHARHRPDLGAEQQPAGGARARRTAARGPVPGVPVEAHRRRRGARAGPGLLGQGLQDGPHRLEVGGDPAGAVDRFQRGQLRRERETRVVADAAGRSGQRQRLQRLAANTRPGARRRAGDSSPTRWAVLQSMASTLWRVAWNWCARPISS